MWGGSWEKRGCCVSRAAEDYRILKTMSFVAKQEDILPYFAVAVYSVASFLHDHSLYLEVAPTEVFMF